MLHFCEIRFSHHQIAADIEFHSFKPRLITLFPKPSAINFTVSVKGGYSDDTRIGFNGSLHKLLLSHHDAEVNDLEAEVSDLEAISLVLKAISLILEAISLDLEAEVNDLEAEVSDLEAEDCTLF